MCHVIVTCRSMLWTLLSIVVAFAELIAFMSADWLIGKGKSRSGAEPASADPEPYHPTLGIYARCIRNPGVQHVLRDTLCGPYAESFSEIASGFWQATAIFLALGILILCTVALVSVFTMCVQSIMKKSIFNVCGLLQGIAGLFLILGLILYPAGWGCQKAIDYCGHYASAYKPGDCSLGWAFYTAIGAQSSHSSVLSSLHKQKLQPPVTKYRKKSKRGKTLSASFSLEETWMPFSFLHDLVKVFDI